MPFAVYKSSTSASLGSYSPRTLANFSLVLSSLTSLVALCVNLPVLGSIVIGVAYLLIEAPPGDPIGSDKTSIISCLSFPSGLCKLAIAFNV